VTIKTETLYMYEYINYRAPERYVSAYKEQDMSHLKGSIILLGEVEVDIDYPEIDTRQAQIDALESEAQEIRAESQSKINYLLDHISKLKAITHEVSV
jgi:hypothetical protein